MKNSLLKETETIGDNMNQFVMLKKEYDTPTVKEKMVMKKYV